MAKINSFLLGAMFALYYSDVTIVCKVQKVFKFYTIFFKVKGKFCVYWAVAQLGVVAPRAG